MHWSPISLLFLVSCVVAQEEEFGVQRVLVEDEFEFTLPTGRGYSGVSACERGGNTIVTYASYSYSTGERFLDTFHRNTTGVAPVWTQLPQVKLGGDPITTIEHAYVTIEQTDCEYAAVQFGNNQFDAPIPGFAWSVMKFNWDTLTWKQHGNINQSVDQVRQYGDILIHKNPTSGRIYVMLPQPQTRVLGSFSSAVHMFFIEPWGVDWTRNNLVWIDPDFACGVSMAILEDRLVVTCNNIDSTRLIEARMEVYNYVTAEKLSTLRRDGSGIFISVVGNELYAQKHYEAVTEVFYLSSDNKLNRRPFIISPTYASVLPVGAVYDEVNVLLYKHPNRGLMRVEATKNLGVVSQITAKADGQFHSAINVWKNFNLRPAAMVGNTYSYLEFPDKSSNTATKLGVMRVDEEAFSPPLVAEGYICDPLLSTHIYTAREENWDGWDGDQYSVVAAWELVDNPATCYQKCRRWTKSVVSSGSSELECVGVQVTTPDELSDSLRRYECTYYRQCYLSRIADLPDSKRSNFQFVSNYTRMDRGKFIKYL